MSETNTLNEERILASDNAPCDADSCAPDRAEDTTHNPGANNTEASAEAKTYTADEVRAMVQSESDRRVSGARAKWERDLDERIESEANERAAKLSASYAERVAELEGALAEERAQSARRERRLAIAAALDAAGLSAELIPMVEGVEAGKEDAAIAAVKAVIDERVAAQCARRVASKPPAAGETKRTLSASEIISLPVARLSELMR